MGLLDDLAGKADLGALSGMLGENKDLMSAAASMLSSGEGTMGSAGGMEAMLGQLSSSGLGDQVASWLSSGANKSVDAQQLITALGGDTLKDLASKAGLQPEQAAAGLAAVLPGLVDQLTPDGKAPDADTVNSLLAKFL